MKIIMTIAVAVAAVLGMFAPKSENTINAQQSGPRVPIKEGTSTNWSGYAVESNLLNPKSNVVTDVKGSWIIPSVTCTSLNTYSSAWVGIDGYADNSVEQLGTDQDCVNGVASYYVWYEMYPKPSYRVNLPVKAGDSVSAEVQYLGSGNFQLSLRNVTTGQSFSTRQKAMKARLQSAEWVMEAPWSGGVLPLSNFGEIAFSNASATLSGHTRSISDGLWQNDAITKVSSGGSAKATPSGLSRSGDAFNVLWNHN